MPAAFQPFLEAFKHSKNKRGSAVSAITYAAGNASPAPVLSGSNLIATFTNSFPAAGFVVVFIVTTGAAITTGCTIGGVTAAALGSSGASNPNITAWGATIASSGSKSVVATSAAVFPAAAGCISLCATGASPTPTTTSRNWGFRADPQTTGTTLTLATGGLIVSAGYTATTDIVWQAPAVAEVSDTANSKLYMARSSASDDPSFTSSAAAGVILGLSLAP